MIPVAASGNPVGASATAVSGPVAGGTTNPEVLIEENFEGDETSGLDETSAAIFDPAITSAGGAATWVADAGFKADGSVSVSRRSAHLNLGSYINDAKGSPSGLFELTATLTPTTGSWLSSGFSIHNSPGTGNDFTGTSQNGIATMIYRDTGVIDFWAGPRNTNKVSDGNDAGAGNRTLTITLDLRNYDGATSFGTVSEPQTIRLETSKERGLQTRDPLMMLRAGRCCLWCSIRRA